MYIIHKILLFLAIPVIVLNGCKTDRKNADDQDIQQYDTENTNIKNGPAKFYNDSILVASGNFKKGKKTGLWTYYYTNGQIKSEGNYHNGLKDGMWVEWYQDGDIMWKGEWEKGKRNIAFPSSQARVKFIGNTQNGNILSKDSTYKIRIRVPNVPSEYLFVEVSSGKIEKTDEHDLFIFQPSGEENTVTMAIGYYPDTRFKDFRNLINEIEYEIK